MSLNMVELYMKELLMQQKLQREYLLHQQQQPQQQTFDPQFHGPPLLPLAPSSFPLFHALQQQQQQQHQISSAPAVTPLASSASSSSVSGTVSPQFASTALQFAAIAPGTAGPFAVAPFCAAKPMAFSSAPPPAAKATAMPKQQRFVVSHEATNFDHFANGADFPPLTPLVHQMFNSNNKNNNCNSTLSWLDPSNSTQPKNQHQQSPPSCCGGGGGGGSSSLASLDSFPSPASSDSPDSNSSSSLCAAAVTVPTANAILLAQQQQQQHQQSLYHHQYQCQQQQQHQNVPAASVVPTTTTKNTSAGGIGTIGQKQKAQQQQQQRPMPTDFSELVAATAKSVPQLQQQQQKLVPPQKQYQQLVNTNRSKNVAVTAQKRPAAPSAAVVPSSSSQWAGGASFRKIRRTTVFVPIGTAKSLSLLSSSSSASTNRTATSAAPMAAATTTTAPTSASSSATAAFVGVPASSKSSSATAFTIGTTAAPTSSSSTAVAATKNISSCTTNATTAVKAISANSSCTEATTTTSKRSTSSALTTASTGKSTTKTTASTSAIVSLLLAPPKAQLLEGPAMANKTGGRDRINPITTDQNDRKSLSGERPFPPLAPIGMPQNAQRRCSTDQMPSLAANNGDKVDDDAMMVCYGMEESASDESCSADDDQPPLLLRAEETITTTTTKRESVCAEEGANDEKPAANCGSDQRQQPQLAMMSAEKAENNSGNDQKTATATLALTDSCVPSCSSALSLAPEPVPLANAQKNGTAVVARRVPFRLPAKTRKRTTSVHSDQGDGISVDVAGGRHKQTAHKTTTALPRATTSTVVDRRGCGPIVCRWTRCARRFEDDNQLYDHLATDHVEQLGKLVLQAEQQQQNQCHRIGGTADDGDDGVGCGGGAEQLEQFRCRWRKCEMHARRGDAQKKLDWLLNHLVIRHAPKAHPHKCLFANCTLRFRKLQALKDHLRSAHDDTVPKPNARRSCGDSAKTSWFEIRPRIHVQNSHDCMDARTVEWLRHRLHYTLGGLDGDPDAVGTDFFEAEIGQMPLPKQQQKADDAEAQRQQQQNDAKAVAPVGRMPLTETIAFLRNTFGPPRRRRKLQQVPAARTTSISVPAA